MEKSLDGTYTRMLRMALNVSWKEHMTNIDLYGNIVIYSEDLLLRRYGKMLFLKYLLVTPCFLTYFVLSFVHLQILIAVQFLF